MVDNCEAIDKKEGVKTKKRKRSLLNNYLNRTTDECLFNQFME